MNLAQAQALHPATTSNTPGWLANNINHYNTQEAANYATRLAQWNQDCASWLVSAGNMRAQGAIPPAPPAIPTESWYYDLGDGANYGTVTCQDDTLKLPVLPPILPAGTPGGPAANTGIQASGADNFNAQLLGQLQSIQFDVTDIKAGVDAIKAHFSIS